MERQFDPSPGLGTGPPLLEARGVPKSFPKAGSRRVNDGAMGVPRGATFQLKAGSFTSIIGPSGCGKTTLLRIVDGLVPPDSGEVIFEGRPATSPPAKMSFVFQQFGLLPWRTVLKNVELGLELRGVNPEMRRRTAEEYIRTVGLSGFENHYVSRTSGGMQQRVGLARALAVDPDVLLMDEPFASTDEQTREVLQRQLLQIVKGEVPKTTLSVTHDVDEAIHLSDEIVLLSARPGRVNEVIKVGLPPERWNYDLRSEPAISYGATQAQLISKVIFPASLPSMMVGLRLSLSKSIEGFIIAQMVFAVMGLGGLLDAAADRLQLSEAVALILVLAAVSVALTEVVKYASRKVVPWKESQAIIRE